MKIKLLLTFLLLMLLQTSGFGQIALRGSATSSTTTNTTLTITKPTGLVIGDIMIAQVLQSGNNSGVSVLADATGTGWTKITGSDIRSSNGDYSRATLFYRIATSTEVAAANFSFNLNTSSDDGEGAIVAFSGVDNSNPFDVTPSTLYNLANNAELSANSITTVTTNSAIIMFGAVHNDLNFSNWTTDNDGTLTELYDVPFDANVDIGIGAAWKIKATSGSTGIGTATLSASVRHGSILIALKQACTAPAAPSSVTNGSRCGVGTVNLSATPGSGQTIDWYAAASGGTALLTGNSSYTTPSIAGTTTYYAEARNTTTGCVSATRTAVTATVNTAPVVTVDKLTSNICAGQSVTLTASGDPSNAVTMDGDDYMTISGDPLGTTTDFTFETMLYWTDNTTNWQRIFDFGSSTNNNMFFTPRADAGNFPRYAITTTGNGGEQRINGNTSITTNTWHHLAITYNAATKTGIMYLDGVNIGSNTNMTITPAAITKTYSYFGESQYVADPLLKGSMDEIRLWNVARTASEINTYKATTVPLSSTGLVAYYKLNEATGTISNSAVGSSTVTMSGTPTRVTSTAPITSSDGLTPTYSWSPTTGLNTSSGNVVIASPTTTTTYTVTSTYPNSCTATATAVVNVSAITTQPSTTGQILCINSTATALTIVASAASGNTISSYQWFSNTASSASGGTSISGATSASYTPSTTTSGTLYYYCVVTISSGCTVTSAVSGAITVNALPSVPTGTASQSFCLGASPTVANLVATGTAIKWYAASSGGSALATTTSLTNGTHYYATQTVNGCESTSRFDVTATVNTTPLVPTGTASQSFCSGASPTVANLVATGTAIQWYAASSGGSALATTTSLINGTHYYATQTVNGCESTSRFDVTVTVNTTPSVPTGTASQSFCSGASPTVANLVATGTAIKWYSASSGGSALATTTALTNNTHYYATQTVNGCESTSRFDVTATVNTTPSVPTGTASQSFCSGASPTVANLVATGTAIKWYSVSNGGSALATTTALTNNTHYYATQTVNGCESTSRFDVTATVNTTPSVPTGTASQSFCSGASPTVANLAATGTAIKWYSSSSGGSALGTTTALTNNTHYYATQTVNGCESTSRFDVTATLNPAPTLSGASQVVAVCAGSTATVSLTGLLANSTSTINYTINGAAQTPVTNVVANASGGASFSTPVLSAANNGQNLQITGVTTTSATPNCTAGFNYGFNLQVNAIPSAPGTAGPHSPFCSGFTAQWAWTANATKYYLDVSTSNSFSSFVTGYNNFDVGNNTSYALSGLNPGTVYYYRVRASNNCGASGSSSTMSISTTESPIGAPVAKAISNPNCTDVQLNWDPVTYATGYYVDIATDSGFTSFVSGYNDFYVNHNNYYASGLPGGTLHYRVRATNNCGVTTVSSNTISFTNLGSAGGTISSAHSVCYNTQPSNLTLSGHVGTVVKWQKSTDAAFTSPVDIANTTTSLTGAEIGNLTVNTYVRVVVKNGYCSEVNSSPVLISVNALPTLTSALQPLVACDGAATTINLSNLLASSTFTINYTINGVAQTAVTGVAADVSGNASYTTGVLSLANNGHVLQVTGITNSTTGCTATFARNVTLNVKSDVGSISVNGGTPIVSNGNVMYCPSTTAVFSLAAVSGASTYTWTVPSGWTIVSGQGTTSITATTGTSSQSGNVSVHTDNIVCPSNLWADLSGITSGAPSTLVTKLPICSDPFASIEITSPAPASGISYTVTGISPAVAAVTNSTGKFTGLTPGNYEVRYQTNSGCTSAAFLQTIAGVPSTTLTSSGWSNGAPDSTKDAIFDVDVTIQEETIDACSCQVKAGKNIQVKSNGVLKLVNSLNVSGTITFDDSTSLVQINDNAVNTGSITYKRTTSAIKDFDYVYWSSPVKDQVLNTLSPLTDKYWSWASGAWAAEARTNDMNPAGKGFIIRVPRYVTSQSVIFEGVPNNGVVNIPTQGTDQNNLIGNPYPSAIDADAFINANSTMISGALYFWTHNTARAVNGGGTAMIYVSDDYATYTLTGGAGTEPSTSKNSSGNKVGFDGDIASGQSFFVGSKGVGNFVFNNGMRISDSGKNSQFFKQTATKKEAKVEKSRIWLNLTNAEGAFKQLLVGYITGATNEKDNLYDGVSNNANKFIDFYSQDNSQKYTIQGRALPFVPTDEVPLGYKTTIDGTFKISIDNADGVLTNQEVYLEDKQTNIIHNLKSGDYSFSTTQGEFKDRFVLRYTGKTLGIGDIETPTKGKGVVVSVKKHQIKVNSFDETLKSVKVYDLKGSLVYNKEKLSGNEFVINQLTSSDQLVIVMIQLESGKWHSEEIIFN